ncbi:MAG: hypothetical protein KDD64_15720, partial [Bdellovibrionales bacterium]|nr:hypothetical protein [Bdellovibrionales bacterium]
STPCDCEPGTCLCDSGPDPAEAFGNKYAYLLTDENDAFSAYDQRQDCGWYWLNNVRTNHTSGTPPLFPTDPPGLAELCGSFDDPDDVPDGGPISLLDLYPIDLYSPFDSGIIDRNGAPYEPTKHFRDDYKRFFSFGDGDYSTGNVDDQMNITQHFPDPANFGDRYLAGFDGQWVNADVYEDGDPGTQLGPEPLRTIMAGLRTAMTEFKDRQIAGDQACVVFFDRNTPWFRVLRMTSDFDFLEEFTDFTIPENSPYNSDPNFDPIDFSSIRSTLNTDGIGDRRLRLIRHGVFPFRGSSSDFRVGIGEGLFQLAQARQDGVSTSEFLVMITDGLHNCLGNPTLCGFTYNYYRQAMDELKTEYLNPNLAGENRTPLHIVVTGSHVGPHTVELEEVAGSSPPDGNFIGGAGSQVNCFTDEEYREATPTDPVGLDFVKGTDDPEFAFDNMFEHPFYDANKDLYEIAVVTQGVFGALRPRNDNFCDSVIDPNGNHVGHEGFSPSEYRPLCGEQVETADDGTPDPEVINDVDSDGRRLTDPYCRNEQAQIESLMKEIIGQNPFNIVLMK